MNWYMQTGKDGDVVLNNKISYFRNLRNYKFENILNMYEKINLDKIWTKKRIRNKRNILCL